MSAVDASLVPFSFTHVMYDARDPVGKLMALLSLSPVFVCVAYATLLLSRRDLHVATLALGQLLNEVFNYVLKRLLRQPRPDGFSQLHLHAPKYGMPSNHAQFMGFLAGYVALWALLRWRASATRIVHSHHHHITSSVEKALFVAGVWTLTALVSFGRVYLGYHTPVQVVVGLAVGAVTAGLWFTTVELLMRPHFSRVAAWPLAVVLRVRDCSHVDTLAVEYVAVSRSKGE